MLKYNANVYENTDPGYFDNFTPMNLHELTERQLLDLKVEYYLCTDLESGIMRIGLLVWDLTNKDHPPYLDEMFEFMYDNDIKRGQIGFSKYKAAKP